jgi:hypothetical protein
VAINSWNNNTSGLLADPAVCRLRVPEKWDPPMKTNVLLLMLSKELTKSICSPPPSQPQQASRTAGSDSQFVILPLGHECGNGKCWSTQLSADPG